mmetsp:Transcript_48541/g.155050  ORF Transcript_48541/g.155050 Transcript_48541/m.155050 type:complete len:361 (-) Transcript_48541:83-1165(-)
MDQHQWVPALYQESIRSFCEHSLREVARVKRNLTGLSGDDQASLTWKAEDQVKRMEEAVAANLKFLEKLSELISEPQTVSDLESQQPCAPQGSKPVQTLLQTFVREWSAEGLEERRECFDHLLSALQCHLKTQLEQAMASGASPPRVLCPGVQLGRLAYEVQSRGYACEACEGRALPFFGGEFARRYFAQRETHRIQPFALQTCNRFKAEDHVRIIPLPDIEVQGGKLPAVRFGGFIPLYDDASTRASFDAVLSAFALDTSSNVFRYVRTVAHVVRPGGLWANFGPLAYDTDHDEAHGHGIELSWEELRFAVSHFFEIKEEAFLDSLHAANAESMMQIQYSCIYFKAVRNDTPSLGIGEK